MTPVLDCSSKYSFASANSSIARCSRPGTSFPNFTMSPVSIDTASLTADDCGTVDGAGPGGSPSLHHLLRRFTLVPHPGSGRARGPGPHGTFGPGLAGSFGPPTEGRRACRIENLSRPLALWRAVGRVRRYSMASEVGRVGRRPPRPPSRAFAPRVRWPEGWPDSRQHLRVSPGVQLILYQHGLALSHDLVDSRR